VLLITVQRESPWDLTFGPNGNLFVSSRYTNSVLEYNGTTGAFVRTFASGGGLIQPLGLAFGPNGDLFVSCSPLTGAPGCNSVLEYNGTTGAFVRAFVTSGSGGLQGPNFLTFGPTTTQIPSVPEPATWLLLGSGLAGLLLWRKRTATGAVIQCTMAEAHV
jgi:DNA-binding beta-propeller fold protein YncE